MIAWSDVVAVAPELASVVGATQTAILAAVARQVDTDAWGEFANDGMVYLAAHMASIMGNRGLVTSETLGSMARSYALPPGILGSLALSVYGAEYKRLLDLAVGPPVFVT